MFIGFLVLIDFIYKVKIRIILRLLRQLRQMIFRVNELHTCTPRVYIVSAMLVMVWLYLGYCLVTFWLLIGYGLVVQIGLFIQKKPLFLRNKYEDNTPTQLRIGAHIYQPS